jgi:gamma-glutamyl hydrolase
MGFEMEAILASKNPNILSPVDAENISMALNFTKAAATSEWLGYAPKQIIHNLESQKLTINNHQYGVTPADFEGNSLEKYYSIDSLISLLFSKQQFENVL